MSADGRAAGEEEQGEEDEVAAGDRLSAALLEACKANATATALRLLEQGADACYEDRSQWSCLVWAASHGNEALARALLERGAAAPYRRGAPRKKHSPLHWAAFKGHHRLLWLLMAPGTDLSHHEKDAIGNTPLHQAAAGGSVLCAECLMARGVDVFAKNDRGHTPFNLCTVPEVQGLLQRAMSTTSCRVTGKQFSSNVLRYLCLWTTEVFAEQAVTQMHVYESPEATEKRKPVTFSLEVRDLIQEAEQQLTRALELNQLGSLTEAIGGAENKPVDCRLMHQCMQAKAKLESEIRLGQFMQDQVLTNLEDYGGLHEALSRAIEDAERKRADPARVSWAKALRRKQMAEASLMRAIQGPQKVLTSHITMLEELTKAARVERANEEVVGKAQKLVTKLKSEQEVQRCIAETAPLCAAPAPGDQAAKENLPPWCHDTDLFEAFHEDYKRTVEVAETGEISPALMSQALGQLATIEQLLVERKTREAEQRLKASKKKGKGARF